MSEPTPEYDHDGPDPIEKDGIVYVPLKLAHPLTAEQVAVVQPLVVKDYNVGHTVRVSREWGLAMIEQGRVQVDPHDRAAVKAALFLNSKSQPLTLVEIAEARAEAAAVAAEQAAEQAEKLAQAEKDAQERIEAAKARMAAAADASGPAKVEAAQSEATADASGPAKVEAAQSEAATPAKAPAKRSS